MKADLANVRATGEALASVGPAPPEYEKIDEWLKRVGPEAAGLEQNYLKGMQNRDAQSFSAASDNFKRIKEYLTEAVTEMMNANWPLQ
jgi:hypothetical protein